MDHCIYDGEYITKDKDNKSIKLYMIFDIYYDKGEPVFLLPFYKIDDINNRYNKLLSYDFNENNEFDNEKCTIIKLKEYK